MYRWFVYPHSFDKELVEDLLQELEIGPDAVVWDPFVGAGTTLLACRERGIAALGSDLLPLSVLISRAKTRDYCLEDLQTALSSFDYRIQKGTTDRFADISIVRKALTSRVRVRVSSLLNQVEMLDEPIQLFFLTALLSILEAVSYTVKSGGWLRLDTTKRIRESDIKQSFEHQVEHMLSDLRTVQDRNPSPPLKVWIGDARTEQLETPVNAIITSPPYLNRHDYTRVFALELALVAVTDAQQLKDLRYQTLRSHVEAKSPGLSPNGYREPSLLRQCLDKIELRGANDRRVPKMIEGYFEDMFLVLKAAYGNLTVGGRAAFVIGNVRFSGVMIPVTKLITELGHSVGFTVERVITARYRGNSSQQMGVYGREKARESVVIFRK